MSRITPSPFQQAILDAQTNVALPGGNYSGKSWGAMMKAVQHAEVYGSAGAVIWLRQFSRSSGPVFDEFHTKFLPALGITPDAVNQVEQRVVINGCPIDFVHCEDLATYRTTFSGRSWSLGIFDEVQHYDRDVLLAMETRIRSSTVSTQEIWIANPGGHLMPWAVELFVRPAQALPPGTPFKVEQLGGQWFISLFSNLDSNSFINTVEYSKKLLSQAKGSAAAYRMSRYGDFSSVPGAFFALSNHNYVALRDFAEFTERNNWALVAGLDHGTSAAASFVLMARAEDRTQAGGVVYPRGTHIALCEFTTASQEAGWDTTKPWSIAEIAACVHYTLERHGLPMPVVYADDAIMQNVGTPTNVMKEYQNAGIRVRPAKKGQRVPSLTMLREYIFNAAPPINMNGGEFAMLFANAPPESRDPALFINKALCPYLVACLENAEADPQKPDDLPLTGAVRLYAHGIDAARYCLNASVKHNGETFISVSRSSGPDLETLAKQYTEQRERFGQHVTSIGVNHPNFKHYRGPLK